MKIYFTIKDGKLTHRDSVKQAFALKDGCYEMEIKKKSRRSLQQNAYYWSCVVAMVRDGLKDLGHNLSLEETHEFLKCRFNYREIVDYRTGEVLNIPQSTARLSKEHFGLYLEDIQQFAAEYLQIVIPNPGKPLTISYAP